MSDELNARLRAIVGAANVLEAEADMAPFLSDWRGRYHGRARAVVRPSDTAEVAAVVAACAQAGVAMVPQGGNTGLCGGATPLADGNAVPFYLAANRPLLRDVGAGAMITLADIELDPKSELLALRRLQDQYFFRTGEHSSGYGLTA